MLSSFGKNTIHLEQVSSTNTYLLEMLSKSEPIAEGSVILADHQTSGRGQRGNIWEDSPNQNLCFSLLLKPTWLDLQNQFQLSMVIALAIEQYLSNLGIEQVSIKWPNDIYVGKKKIAGILIENLIQGHSIENTVVGIGLNVNQEDFGIEQGRRSSLALECDRHFNIQDTLSVLMENIDYHYNQLKAGKIEAIEKRYMSKLMYINSYQNYSVAGENVYGKIVGVDASGALELLVGAELRRFQTQEISFLYN